MVRAAMAAILCISIARVYHGRRGGARKQLQENRRPAWHGKGHVRVSRPRSAAQGAESSELPGIPNFAGAREGLLNQLARRVSGEPASDTPLARAQELMYQALDTPDRRTRLKLAQRALEICPDCADAYVILAESAANPQEALNDYQQAVAAGERALGPAAMEESAGHFWGVIQTRPYMRAKMGLAHALADAGQPERAIDVWWEMLKLNPNDNQAVRHTLVSWLLLLDRDLDARSLVDQYDDDSTATWEHSRALLAFRREAGTDDSREALLAAARRNPFVAKLLTDEEEMPSTRPTYYSIGDRNEAALYVQSARCVWRSTPGALSWVKAVFAQPRKPPTHAKRPVGPSPATKDSLRRLPQRESVMHADVRRLPKRLMEDGQRFIPWVILVADETTDLILSTAIALEAPTADQLWDHVVKACARPSAGEPHRPARIVVKRDPRWEALSPHFREIGIELEVAQTFPYLDKLFRSMIAKLTDGEPAGLLDAPRVQPEAVAGLFTAASDFYRKAPWRFVPDSYALKVECARFESGPWFGVIMGQSGITMGSALYDTIEMVRAVWSSKARDPDASRRATMLSITFDDESEAIAKDVVAAWERGWEVAGPEAFPLVYRKEPGMTIRPPLAWELVLLEGYLRAVPEFIARHRPGDAARESFTVPVASGELDLVLSWVV